VVFVARRPRKGFAWCALSHGARSLDTAGVKDRKQARSKYGSNAPRKRKYQQQFGFIKLIYKKIIRGSYAKTQRSFPNVKSFRIRNSVIRIYPSS